MMNLNFFKYIQLGVSGAETVTAFIAIVEAKQPINGIQVEEAVQPVILALQAGWNINLPSQLVTDISTVAADSINKYVFGISK